MLVTNHMLGLPEPLDHALELFATSKDECLAYLRELGDYDQKTMEIRIVQEGIFHHADFVVWYVENNLATEHFIRSMMLATYVAKKIVNHNRK